MSAPDLSSSDPVASRPERIARAAAAVLWAAAIPGLFALATQALLALLAPAPASADGGGTATAALARVIHAEAVPPAALPAPGAGTTGTIALPPMPASAVAPPPGAAMATVAARPFVATAAGTTDRGRALECLTAAIYYEAASESDDGQRAVAQVVLNRVRHAAFPATVCGVVYQGSERAGCQFSFACDGAMARVPSRTGWARAARNAAAALAGYVYAPVGLATHYHTFAVTPAWNRTLVMTDAVGAHFFHRWKGWWGTSAAFTQVYRGGEPVPGPHAPVIAPPAVAALPVTPPVLPGDTPLPPLPGATLPGQPARATPATAAVAPVQSGDAITPYANNDESQILDRWKDSGKPIR